MMGWLLIGAMVVGACVLLLGAACGLLARDVESEDRAEGKFIAECAERDEP